MAIPKCPKCDLTKFQVTMQSPENSNWKICLVHCASCGCVVGTEPAINTAYLLNEMAKKLKIGTLPI